ncbi:MAG: PEF-CTERM sorting domain-containing protein [Methanolobus sp.]|jgi:hypothetical protein|nr:PEF-CTERM sorting domain-containing protein [Methanolobus sp.]
MKKILIIAFIAFVAMVGSASAILTHDAAVWSADGTGAASNPVQIKPGQTVTLSYHATELMDGSIGKSADYSYQTGVISGSGVAGDLVVNFAHPEFTPTSAPVYTDIGVIELTMDEEAPYGTMYKVTVQVADNEEAFIYGQASRGVEAIPEFPTVALPVAAILGLAFFMQRRKEE